MCAASIRTARTEIFRASRLALGRTQTEARTATIQTCSACTTVNGTEQYVQDQHHKTITTAQYYGPNATIGEIDYTTNDTTSYGTALQATDKEKLFGLNNIFIAGASVDHGDVKSTSIAELGTLNTQNLTITGNGIYLSGPLDIAPVNLTHHDQLLRAVLHRHAGPHQVVLRDGWRPLQLRGTRSRRSHRPSDRQSCLYALQPDGGPHL